MAMPAYVVAYAYTDFLQVSGPLQSTLRDITGWQYGDYWFPEVRSLGGAAAMLFLVLYPYVYMLARAAFLEQSVCALFAERLRHHSDDRAPLLVGFRLNGRESQRTAQAHQQARQQEAPSASSGHPAAGT